MKSYYPEDGENIFLRKVDIHLHDYTVSRPRQLQSDPHKIKWNLFFLIWFTICREVKFVQVVREKYIPS